MMINRNFNIKNSHDFSELNKFENEIMPLLRKAKFDKVSNKKIVETYMRSYFFNQWKTKRGNNG